MIVFICFIFNSAVDSWISTGS